MNPLGFEGVNVVEEFSVDAHGVELPRAAAELYSNPRA